MKYLKVLELFKPFKHYDVEEKNSRGNNFYYFTSDKGWRYELGFHKREDGNYFFGFKAKKDEDFFFDKDVITNDNPFKVLSTMKYIFDEHYQKYNPEKYIFSVQSTDQTHGIKRKSMYLKMLSEMPMWNVTKDPDMDRWYLTRK
jgi:hypothetical protein